MRRGRKAPEPHFQAVTTVKKIKTTEAIFRGALVIKSQTQTIVDFDALIKDRGDLEAFAEKVKQAIIDNGAKVLNA